MSDNLILVVATDLDKEQVGLEDTLDSKDKRVEYNKNFQEHTY